jgi:hypothetical protein
MLHSIATVVNGRANAPASGKGGTGPERPSSNPETRDDPAATGSVVPIRVFWKERHSAEAAVL